MPLAEDVDHRYDEFVPLAVANQSLHVRQLRLTLSIDPLDICGVAFELRSCWFVEGVALLICKELLHPTASDLLHPCLLCAAEELHQKPSKGRSIFGVIV